MLMVSGFLGSGEDYKRAFGVFPLHASFKVSTGTWLGPPPPSVPPFPSLTLVETVAPYSIQRHAAYIAQRHTAYSAQRHAAYTIQQPSLVEGQSVVLPLSLSLLSLPSLRLYSFSSLFSLFPFLIFLFLFSLFPSLFNLIPSLCRPHPVLTSGASRTVLPSIRSRAGQLRGERGHHEGG